MDPYWPVFLAMTMQKCFTFTKNHETGTAENHETRNHQI